MVSTLLVLGWALAAGAALTPSLSSAAPPNRAPGPARQWEYLVVSSGRASFSPVGRGSKSAEAWPFGFMNEAASLQGDMDAMGERGWELVAVIGQIGGDQAFIFKRPCVKEVPSPVSFPEVRSTAEGLAPAPPAMVDLDQKENDERLAKLREQVRKKVEPVIANLPPSLHADASRLVYEPSSIGGTLVVDGTAELLSPDNSYRSSAAEALAQRVWGQLADAIVAGTALRRTEAGTEDVIVKIKGVRIASYSRWEALAESGHSP
jgi:hypothetical protein